MASSFVRAKAILPRRFNPNAFDDEFLKAADSTAKQTDRLFKRTHRTWNEQKPTWKKKLKLSDKELTWTVSTDNLIYYFLNNGTVVRYAAMTPGFQPKTKVRTLRSFAGSGGFSHLRFNPPPGPSGIEGRFWDEEVEKRMKPIVFKRYESAMKAGVKRCGHSYS